MKEDFLHFVWRTLNFDFRNLKTNKGETVEILETGRWNHGQGPDFLAARVRIGDMEWMGAVEMHVGSHEWYIHGHHRDTAYNSVVLHVVAFGCEEPVVRQDGTEIPELMIGDRIFQEVEQRYLSLILSENSLPCRDGLTALPSLVRDGWTDRLGLERLDAKAKRMGERLSQLRQDWDQLAWEEIAAGFGGKENGDVFREMASRLPVTLTRKYANDRIRTEALLMGAAGMLSGCREQDDYVSSLRSEWNFLRAKHRLEPTAFPLRLMRMRPASFPWARLSQLAALLQQFPGMSGLIDPVMLSNFIHMEADAHPYWKTHYRFGEETAVHPVSLGAEAKRHLLINTLIPLLWLFAQAYARPEWEEEAALLMENLPPENNRVTRQYAAYGFSNANALLSQGILALSRQYCQPRKCVTCAIGIQLIRKTVSPWKTIPSSS